MSLAGRVLLFIDVALMLAALAGLLIRRRAGASPAFVLYLLVSVPLAVALPIWPALHGWGYWLGSRSIQTALRLIICVDLASRIFGRLPRARRRASALLVVVAVATLAIVARLAALPVAHPYYEASRILEHVTFAGAMLMTVVLGLAWWHAVPVDRLQREIGAGLLVWSLAHALQDQLAAVDPWLGLGPGALARLIYAGVLLAWAVEAWRPEEDCPPELLPLLRPWRHA